MTGGWCLARPERAQRTGENTGENTRENPAVYASIPVLYFELILY